MTGYKIKMIRKELGLTMEEFGERIGKPFASDSIISRWERGVNLPNNERLKRIAEIGEVSVEELLCSNVKHTKNTDSDNIKVIKRGDTYEINIKKGESYHFFSLDRNEMIELVNKATEAVKE